MFQYKLVLLRWGNTFLHRPANSPHSTRRYKKTHGHINIGNSGTMVVVVEEEETGTWSGRGLGRVGSGLRWAGGGGRWGSGGLVVWTGHSNRYNQGFGEEGRRRRTMSHQEFPLLLPVVALGVCGHMGFGHHTDEVPLLLGGLQSVPRRLLQFLPPTALPVLLD